MKTVFLLFDSLNRRMLAPYNKEVNYTPNFDRLAKKSITFNNHYIGSMPCMPARRDMQSGRLSFLHRSWGPLEPFDNSFPEILRLNNTYTHLITDHNHYFEDGGSTYHNRYNSFDFIRGQERDPWKAMVEPPIERFKKMYHQSQSDFTNRESRYYFYPINSEFIKEEKDFPSVQCFASGLDFLKTNKDAKDWFLQIETFDPHEPFFAPERFKEKFKTGYNGPRLDWPQYERVKETPNEVDELKANYLALISLCDFLLGSILDYFDEHKLWDDTALILTTDHGFMLGEHDWWAKNRMPVYDEIAHIPLLIYHPDFADAGATFITFHPEATQNVSTTLELIKAAGCKSGLAINPDTPLTHIEDHIESLDIITMMSVYPGFAGQSFIPEVLDKLSLTRKIIDDAGKNTFLEIDGGVKVNNIGDIARYGADVFVSGSGIFGTEDYRVTIDSMRNELSSI